MSLWTLTSCLSVWPSKSTHGPVAILLDYLEMEDDWPGPQNLTVNPSFVSGVISENVVRGLACYHS